MIYSRRETRREETNVEALMRKVEEELSVKLLPQTINYLFAIIAMPGCLEFLKDLYIYSLLL